MVMYNFALAFVICAVVYIIGEVVATVTKAWVPSVFVTAVVLLIGYWTVIPKTVVSDSVLLPFGSSIGIYLLITHMGTVISLKQLKEQWRTIVAVSYTHLDVYKRQVRHRQTAKLLPRMCSRRVRWHRPTGRTQAHSRT